MDDVTSEVSHVINSLAVNSRPLRNWRLSVLCVMITLNLEYIRVFYCGWFVFSAFNRSQNAMYS